MKQHEANARHLAAWLEGHAEIERLYYPGLKNHPQRALQEEQARGYGGMISFDVGTIERAKQVLKKTRLFTLAESLGGVESLISHPASMTHGSVPKEKRDKLGVTEGLIRISVGIEDVEDLQADLVTALTF
jgi:cystathionine beta-lyase/cystathionine gamma-synthase